MTKESITAATNQTAEKLLYVLEALAKHGRPVKLIDLSRELGMNTSTLYRFLTALENMGYIAREESSGYYGLNLKICYLAELVKQRFNISAALHSAVVDAGNLFRESAHLAQEENHMIVYVDNVAGASQMLTIRQYIGKTAAMHCTGVGKLFMLEYTNEQIDELIREKGLPRFTALTITTKEALLDELETVRRQGYAFDNEECELGVRCVAVPVRDYRGKIVAAISVSGPITRITDEQIRTKLPQLLEISRRASASLGFMG